MGPTRELPLPIGKLLSGPGSKVPYKKLQIEPGIKRDSTRLAAGPRWYDANNVRWRDPYTETVGGWVDDEMLTLQGIGRGLHAWEDFSNHQYQCIGTAFKFYLKAGTEVVDITPEDRTSSFTDKITTTQFSALMLVNDVGHGASINDYVVFTAMADADVGGFLKEYFLENYEGFQIYDVIDDNNYMIKMIGKFASSNDTGGGLTEVSYKVTSGVSTSLGGGGFGIGPFGGDDTTETAYVFNNPNPVSTIGVGDATLTLDVTGFTGSAFAIGDYIYPYDLVGTIDGINLDFLNNKWWYVSDLDGVKPKIEFPYNADGGPTSGGGTGSFYHDDIDAVPPGVVGALRGWGEPTTLELIEGQMRTVSIENFGEDLMFSNRGGPIYYYDVSVKTSSGVPVQSELGVTIGSISGAVGTPTTVDSFLVSEAHGHTIALGVNDIGQPQQNKMLVRWSDRHNPFIWLPNSSNESGGEVLRHGSSILKGVATKEEIIIFTTSAAYSMRYVGYPEVYGITRISGDVSLYSRGSAVAVDNSVYFMANDQFYEYNGSIVPLAKDLSSYVFQNINTSQSAKVFTAVNSSFSEVIWFYPDGDSFECNRWVSYCWISRAWSMGSYDMSALDEIGGFNPKVNPTYSRTAWQDKDIFTKPLALYITDYDPSATPEAYTSSIMKHEFGVNAQSAGMDAYAESGEVDIEDGDSIAFFNHLIPDIEAIGLEESATDPTVTMTLSVRKIPGRKITGTSSIVVDFGAQTDAELDYSPDDNATGVRGRGRQVSLRVASSNSGYGWRLGVNRLNIRPDGKK
jgi:hypothetical protein